MKTNSKKAAKFGPKGNERRKRNATAGSERRRIAKDTAASPVATEPSYTVHFFALEDIKIKKSLSAIHPDTVERIVGGYRTHGQLMPVTVRLIHGVPHLATGVHRWHAAKALGLKKVPCFVIRGGKTMAALWSISENRDRKILTVLDQAEQMAEWFRLMDEMNPVSKEAEKHGPGRPEGAKKKALRSLPIPGRTEAAKEKALARLLKIAAIDSAAKLAAREAGSANSQKKLLQISDESTPKAQLAKALASGSGKAPPKRPGSGGGVAASALEKAKAEFLGATTLLRALKRLSTEHEVRIFLAFVLAWVLGKDLDDEVFKDDNGAFDDNHETVVEDTEDSEDKKGDDEDGDDDGDDDED